MGYLEIKNVEPTLNNCFFAFSKSQLEEGLQKWNLTKEQIVSGIGGLFGTREGIKELYSFYDAQAAKIKQEVDPQEMYNYEFDNYECGYTNCDEKAINMIVHYYGVEIARTVKRRFAYTTI